MFVFVCIRNMCPLRVCVKKRESVSAHEFGYVCVSKCVCVCVCVCVYVKRVCV